MQTTTTKDLVLDAWKTFGTRDPERIGAVLTEDAEWLAPASNAAARLLGYHHLVGRERILQFLTRQLEETFGTDMTSDVTRVVAEGDTVVLQTRLRSTLPGGRPYDNEYCFLVTVRDGRIHRIHEHLDTHRGLLAFGLVEDPAG
jgi:ketosteroid isomerase-like protein